MQGYKGINGMRNIYLQFDFQVKNFISKLSDYPDDTSGIINSIYTEISRTVPEIKKDERLFKWLDLKIKRGFINYICSGKQPFWDYDELTRQQLELFEEYSRDTELFFAEPLLNILSENHQTLLKLSEFEKLSVETIAEKLGTGKESVQSELEEARNKFIELIRACSDYNCEKFEFGPDTIKTAV